MSPLDAPAYLTESFGALLSEKLAELDAAETVTYLVLEETAVDRLRLEAQQSVLATEGGPLPRQGHSAYLSPPDAVTEPGQRHLNILH
jgi:hypothetical protein